MTNLRDAVCAVLDGTSLADPGEIADKVAESLPDDQLRDALSVTLRAFVREVIRARRAGVDHENESSAGDQTVSDAQSSAVPGGPSAWKTEGLREALDAWKRRLTDRYESGESEWKLLSDMSAADLRYAATRRFEQARRTWRKGEQLQRWAALVEEHGVDAFGDLPVDVQKEALS